MTSVKLLIPLIFIALTIQGYYFEHIPDKDDLSSQDSPRKKIIEDNVETNEIQENIPIENPNPTHSSKDIEEKNEVEKENLLLNDEQEASIHYKRARINRLLKHYPKRGEEFSPYSRLQMKNRVKNRPQPGVEIQKDSIMDIEVDNYVVYNYDFEIHTDNYADRFPIVDDGDQTVFPGALLQYNTALKTGRPDPILLDNRAPINVTVSRLLGLGESEAYEFQCRPDNDYVDKFQKFITNYLKKTQINNKGEKFGVEANMVVKKEEITNRDEMVAKFGLGIQAIEDSLNIDFEKVKKLEKRVAILMFKQQFFATEIPPMQPADLFTTYDIKEIKDNFDDSDWPIMVNKVFYGRTLYVRISTSESGDDTGVKMNTAFDFLTRISLKANAEYKNTQNESKFDIIIYEHGGSARGASKLTRTTNLNEVGRVIEEYSEITPENVGSPIEFTATFMNASAVQFGLPDYETYAINEEIWKGFLIVFNYTGTDGVSIKIDSVEKDLIGGSDELTHRTNPPKSCDTNPGCQHIFAFPGNTVQCNVTISGPGFNRQYSIPYHLKRPVIRHIYLDKPNFMTELGLEYMGVSETNNQFISFEPPLTDSS